WSFWLHRDGEQQPDGSVLAAWPRSLRKFLDGHTRLAVVIHGSQEPVFDEELSFGSSDARIAVVDRDGNELATDKTQKLVKTFATRSPEHVAPLLDAIAEVLGALKTAGVDAFLAYGTALGAVREGRLLGHDSDADLGYVSEHTYPVDVIRESFRLQARLSEMGYPTFRYSGAAFKVSVREGDGALRGLDVFGGFMNDGHLYLMGEIRVPFRRDWVFPLGTATLEGREFPVPANTDRFLAATYGDSWREPDPAFKFETPATTYRRLNGWFRGIRVNRGLWDSLYNRAAEPTDLEPSALARWVLEREGTVSDFVDLGCGFGVDARWMASQGARATGFDRSPNAYAAVAARCEREGLDARFRTLNLLELRSVLSAGALVAARPGPRTVMARHLVDAVDARARENLWRMVSMSLRDGGSLYLEFLSRRGDDRYAGRHHVKPRPVGLIARELTAAGATVSHRESLLASDPAGTGQGTNPSKICRMVASWER
ncbi:MAG: methyltransferase domain-containing protein, partial [Nocardioides sp.]